MDSKKSAILKTLIYSDIFDFPLTKQEIWRYLITNKKIFKKDFIKLLVNKQILSINNFYFLKGREKIVEKRIDRKKIGLIKIAKAKKIINIISFIPSIYLVGITGSLALRNSKENEDIDVFMVCAKKTVWITRLLVVIILKFSGNYRNRSAKILKDKICLNMIIGEDCLKMKEKKQDIYIAHEIIQLVPIFERKKTYNRFLKSNIWVKSFMFNSLDKMQNRVIKKKERESIVSVLRIFDSFAKKIQFYLMKKHITRETVLDNYLAFHPIDYRIKILREFNKRIKNG